MAKFQIAQNMGWANVDVTDVLAPMAAQIAAQMRPGKPAGFYDGVRFSVNKRAGSVVLGIATAELDRIDAAAKAEVKAAGDKAAPAAVAGMAELQAQVAALMKALAAGTAGNTPVGDVVPSAVAAPGRRAGRRKSA